MRKLEIGIIDLVSKAPTSALWARVMNANFASIMPQVVANWCEELGHSVTLVCYTGRENLLEEIPNTADVVILGAFTEAAQLSYALSQMFRSRGAITALGGSHARCYPQDAQQHFDYVVGFTDKAIIRDLLQDCSQHRPVGIHLTAKQQPATLPGVRERWKFIEQTLRKSPLVKIVPMVGSLGCPYTCEFCIDAAVPHQQFDFETVKEDLRFLLGKFKRPHVGWHDPNFGIRFDDWMDAIEDAVPPDSIDFIAESSLSILSEPHMNRLRQNGFKALLPGIESWSTLGGKSKTGNSKGIDKVRHVSEQINMILRYVPYVQTNFVFGLDVDEGPDPFELTKKFLDLSPGAFPAFSLLTAFGEAARLNLMYQQENRVLPFPFHFLNNCHAMNVRVKGYAWTEFYDHMIDVTRYASSGKMIIRRLNANGPRLPGWLNVIRAVSTEGTGRLKYYRGIRERLDTDPQFRAYFEQETTELPRFYTDRIRRDLGPFWDWLPTGAIQHDAYAYLKAESARRVIHPPVNDFAKAAPIIELDAGIIHARAANG